MALISGACAPTGEAPGEGSPWRLSPAPPTVIYASHAGADPLIGQVWSGTRMGDGTVVVLDLYGASLHIFGGDGGYRRAVGRTGHGPGEWGSPIWVGGCGSDVLRVLDLVRRTVVEVDTTGAFLTTLTLEIPAQEMHCSVHSEVVLKGWPEMFLPPSDDGMRSPAPIWIPDARGGVAKRVLTAPYGDNRVLGRLTRIAHGPGRIYVGTADSAWVDMYDPGGGFLGAVPIGVEGRVATETQFRTATERIVAIVGNRENRERAKEPYLSIGPPTRLPPYSELFADPAGALWAVVSVPGDPETRLRVVDPGTGTAGEIVLHGEVRVFEIGIDYLLGVREGSDGVQTVLVFGLEREHG